MKTKTILIVSCFATLFAVAADKVQLTDAERAAKRAEMIRRTGGLIKIPAQGHVTLIDYQKKADHEKLARKFAETFEGFHLPTKAVSSETPFALSDMKTKAKEVGAGSVVMVVDDPLLPMSLVSIETRCGVVNVAALAADNPSAAVLTRRTGKMVGRVAMLASGGAESDSPTSSLKTVTSLAELDANEGLGDEVYVMMGVIRGMQRAGVMPERVITYKQACKQGIASAPTNDIQKAVWDQVKSDKERGPTNGMKILP